VKEPGCLRLWCPRGETYHDWAGAALAIYETPKASGSRRRLVWFDILDDRGYTKVVEDVVNREIVVIEVLSSELSNGGALS
jgi:hypothetical protein